ncbi:MAG TPA: lysophospholipid acyltransferase family protein [Aldersonia sp.]
MFAAGVLHLVSLAADLGLALSGVDVRVQGEEHLWSHRPAVFVFNHQSSLVDGLLIFRLLRKNFTGVAKKEAANMPAFGPILRLADVAFVDRGNTAQAKQALAPAVDWTLSHDEQQADPVCHAGGS